MSKSTIVVLIMFFSGLAFSGGGWLGYERGKLQRPCFECCVEGEMCQNEEEWANILIGASGDQGDAAEMSRLLNECWKECDVLSAPDTNRLPELTQCALALSECRGALKECQRK